MTDDNSEKVRSSQPNVLKRYGLEICVLLFSVADSTFSITVQNFYIDRICQVTKNFTKEECRNLTSGAYNHDETLTEVTASEYTIYKNLIESGLPIILSIFLGSWIDKNGSKPVLIMSILGYFTASLVYILFSMLPNAPPSYILISSVPIPLGGGAPALVLSTVSLVTREASIKDRSFQLSVLSICYDGGASIGLYLGEKVYKITGYTDVFGIGAILYGLSMICAMFLISEKKPDTRMSAGSTCCSKWVDFFDIGAFKDTVFTCFKKRQEKRRRWVLLLILCIILQMLSYCSRGYLFLYSRNKLGWEFDDYSNFAIFTALSFNIGGLLMTLVAIKLLRIPDTFLGLITVLSNLTGLLVTIFATSGWLMYLASAVQMLGAITTAVMRSILSKIVAVEEHGKLFSFVTCTELAMPFIASSIYGLIYMNTATTLPSALFILPISIQAFMVLSYLYLYHAMKNSSPYAALREENFSSRDVE
ncbi:unnamed protein product [Orchesella dallaii]|uniref:Proton-coupled folate transporter n=1 Tax=Orchesella dallaii TaxID=48710 RepID=A0ABP1Q483_9HEXA